ncbi:PAS domain S-box protein, partial [Candidatus Desantisbacteria bacterium]|nr:PAS domain S-box protein [Candidatus Desantisbacteria bacterium]
MNKNEHSTIENLSLVYELSLSIGRSLDLKTNCEGFLKTLMSRKNLTYSAVWLKNKYLSDETNKKWAILVYAYPMARAGMRQIPVDHPIFSLLKGKDVLLVSSQEDTFTQLLVSEKGITEGGLIIFALGDIGVLKLFSPAKISEEEINQLKTLIPKFTTSIEGCLSYQQTLKELGLVKAAEEKLRLYKFMVESAHDAIFFKDLESRYIIANQKALEAFGLSAQEVIGRNDYELMPDHEEAKKNVEDDQIVFKTGKPAEVTKHMTAADGSHRWFQAIKVPQFDDQGNILGLVGIARDVTENELMEMELRKYRDHLQELVKERSEELVESEEKYRNLVERANDGICIIQDSLFKYVNPQFGLMLGYSVEEMLGTPFIRYIHANELIKITDMYYRRMAGEDVPQRYDTMLKYKDGHAIEVELNAGIITYQGCPADLVFIRDITQRKQMEKEIIKTEKLAAAVQIASEAAHEIKNPLAVIKAGIYYLERILPEDNNIQKTISHMDGAVQRAVVYIDDLLNFSRPPELLKSWININEMIKKVMDELPAEIFSGIKVQQELSNDLPDILADFDKLKQVVTNLVRNAADAMMEVKNKRLKVESEKRWDAIRIIVSDTGAGITREDRRRIFDPFFTTKGKGTGLGLAICQRIVEAHNGEIEVKSKVGEGTTFVIKLPVECRL